MAKKRKLQKKAQQPQSKAQLKLKQKQVTKQSKNLTWIFVILAVIFLAAAIYFYTLQKSYDEALKNDFVYISHLEQLTGVGKLSSTHIHADMKIYINFLELDLNREEFQAPDYGTLEFWREAKVNRFTHLHNGEDNVDVVHVHATGITLGMFLKTLGIKLTSKCITFEQEGAYCNDEIGSLKVYINGKIVPDSANYEIRDLDKILISYGSESEEEILEQLASIGNNACKQSAKC